MAKRFKQRDPDDDYCLVLEKAGRGHFEVKDPVTKRVSCLPLSRTSFVFRRMKRKEVQEGYRKLTLVYYVPKGIGEKDARSKRRRSIERAVLAELGDENLESAGHPDPT